MGFLDKFRKSIPGSPVSLAKITLKVFRSYREQNPDCLQEDAYRYVIETRYKIIKTVKQARIEWILERTDCLETLAFLTFLEENNLIKLIDMDDNGSGDPLIQQIGDDISEFFKQHAYEESYFGKNK